MSARSRSSIQASRGPSPSRSRQATTCSSAMSPGISRRACGPSSPSPNRAHGPSLPAAPGGRTPPGRRWSTAAPAYPSLAPAAPVRRIRGTTIDMTETNWAGNIAYAAGSISVPRTVSEVQAAVQAATKLRPLGSRHSFNRISDTAGTLLSLRGLERRFELDRAARTVTVDGGMTYGELGPRLAEAGYALHNLASLPHISIVGAVATATHGSGNANRNLAGAVTSLELVTAAGDIVRLKRGDADFDGAVVSLGALGVVTAITLDVEPAFEVRQNVYLDLPFETYVENFEAITGSAYSVSAFTHWCDDTIAHVWLKSRSTAPMRS